MEQAEKKSYKTLWIVVVVVGVFFVVLGTTIVLMAQLGTTESTNKDTLKTSSSDTKNVTQQDVEKNIEDVRSSLKQAIADQKAVEEALNDDKNQIKADY